MVKKNMVKQDPLTSPSSEQAAPMPEPNYASQYSKYIHLQALPIPPQDHLFPLHLSLLSQLLIPHQTH